MERTRHVLLAGPGAEAFAAAQGFTREELLREPARLRWQEWRQSGDAGFLRPPDDHDTVGVLGVDGREAVAGVSTSGLGFKLPGRVGDSPLVGAGGYADAEVGAAAATGIGEEIIRVLGAFAVVEAMHRGDEPEQACRQVLERLRRRRGGHLGQGQVALIALRGDGAFGAAALQVGFEHFVHQRGSTRRHVVPPLG